MYVMLYEAGDPVAQTGGKSLGLLELVDGAVVPRARLGRFSQVEGVLATEINGLTATSDPEGWLSALRSVFQSDHLWATEAQEGEPPAVVAPPQPEES